MKLGILTFHAQLNYGGVLQAYALQEALNAMGHEVVIIDRWLDERNAHLLGPISLREKRGAFIRGCFLNGTFSRLKRFKKTTRFVKRNLHLTPYHFYQWSEAPKDLGVDALVVGSDQVWNGTFGNPCPYLLDGVPTLPALAYAASFGMRALPDKLLPFYRQGFARFLAISCREKEGVTLVQQEGFEATHVVDPTQLLAPSHWKTRANEMAFKGKTLVCYLLAEDILAALPTLYAFAKKMKCKVKVFINYFLLPIPKNKEAIKKWLNYFRWTHPFSPLQLCLSADPQAFLDAHASATWVLTDSFHSVMFSSIFDKNVRLIRPTNDFRKAMFARIEEFASTSVEGQMLVDSLDEALTSFAKGETVTFKQEVIAARREHSRAWLEAALAASASAAVASGTWRVASEAATASPTGN